MKFDSIGAGKLVGAAAVVALVAGWPIIQSVKADWEAEQAAKSAATRQKLQDYMKTREELGMANPFPPKDLLDKQDAEARRLGGGRNVFEAAISNLGPTFMEVEFTHAGVERCRDAVRGLSHNKEVRIVVNGQSAYRKDAWKLCGGGLNHIKAVHG